MPYYTTAQIEGLIKKRIKSIEISGVHGPCNADCCLLGLTCCLEGCCWRCRENCCLCLQGWSIHSSTINREPARSSVTFIPTNQTIRQERRRLKSTTYLLLTNFSRVAGITFAEMRWKGFLTHTYTHTILITILILTGILSHLNINSENS